MRLLGIAFAALLTCSFTAVAHADSYSDLSNSIQLILDSQNAAVQNQLNAAEPPIQIDVCILKKHGSCGGAQSNCDTGNTCQNHETGGIINIKSCSCQKKPTKSSSQGSY